MPAAEEQLGSPGCAAGVSSGRGHRTPAPPVSCLAPHAARGRCRPPAPRSGGRCVGCEGAAPRPVRARSDGGRAGAAHARPAGVGLAPWEKARVWPRPGDACPGGEPRDAAVSPAVARFPPGLRTRRAAPPVSHPLLWKEREWRAFELASERARGSPWAERERDRWRSRAGCAVVCRPAGPAALRGGPPPLPASSPFVPSTPPGLLLAPAPPPLPVGRLLPEPAGPCSLSARPPPSPPAGRMGRASWLVRPPSPRSRACARGGSPPSPPAAALPPLFLLDSTRGV